MSRAGRGDSPDAVDLIVEQWRHSRPELDTSALAVLGRLHRSYRRYHAQIGALFDRHGISMGAFDLLSALRRSGEPYRLSAGVLAEQTLVTTGGLTQRVDRLEEQGLVVRERNVGDGRVVHVRLTDEGRALIDKVADDHFANERGMLIGLTGAERQQLAGLLRRLERSMELAELAADSAAEE
ncbi:MarR family winged helix-turn-helix transcriptional regulator [Tamaricihabitans halophyticus]|uniref:MarR family winged helix-turn-helix transcriptional regulator n=1 Tax=Tamaricihabitans halophyticus TaxID=1262583 RepID=UPI0010444C53|nr:MarR family transcriptional regulator [Tamaricihabitans halophyticus]